MFAEDLRLALVAGIKIRKIPPPCCLPYRAAPSHSWTTRGDRRYVDVRAAMGFTPIHMAASQGHWQTVAALLANGASLAVRFDPQLIAHGLQDATLRTS